jgi:hypothetical protein
MHSHLPDSGLLESLIELRAFDESCKFELAASLMKFLEQLDRAAPRKIRAD